MLNERMEKEYTLSHLQPDVHYLPVWAELSAAFRTTANGQIDLAYGDGERDRLDYFPAANARSAPTLIFIHGGWWQKGDKSVYSFLAEPFLAKGISFLALNYDFCPNVRMTQIVDQVFKSMAWIDDNIERMGGNRDKLVIAGHSAGGHLGGMMTTVDPAPGTKRVRPGMLKGAVLLSGIFDLEPLMDTTINDALRLDAEEARVQSPVRRALNLSGRLVVGCGDDESSEFNRQSDAYVAAHRSADIDVTRVGAPAHHFGIINVLADPNSALFQTTVEVAAV